MSYNIYFNKVAELTSQQLPDYLDVQYWRDKYIKARDYYKSTYPSEAIKVKTVYYRDPTLRRIKGNYHGNYF